MKTAKIQTQIAMALGLSLLFAAGCGQKRTPYVPPVAPQLAKVESWSTPLAGGAAAKPADDQTLAHWWTSLNDPILTSLEDRAVKSNLDIRKAEARIRQARAQRDAATTATRPSVNASASAAGSRSGTHQSYNTGLDASWELDFFGRIRSTIEAYQADLDGAQEDLRDVLVSLTAEVALDYINIRSYQTQLALTRSSLAAQEETYQLTVARFESGLATELDVAQARLSVESAKASIPSLESNMQQAANNIAVLLGERPGAIDSEVAAIKAVPSVPLEIAVGVPADLVRRRPDIRSAERQVAAQAARVNVARADLYPTFTLSGNLGLAALNFTNLFTASNSIAAGGAGSVAQTIFNRRKIREQIKVQDAVLDQTLAAYESTVIGALEDAENALLSFAKEQVRRKSLADAAVAADRALTLSRELYAAGLKDFLDVLDAQRSLLTLQNQVAQSDATITANLVRLYKALGGGTQ